MPRCFLRHSILSVSICLLAGCGCRRKRDIFKKEIKSIDKIIEKTKEYSGAYMKELVDLTLIISKEEDILIEKAIYQALEKIETQKKLIEEIKKNKTKIKVNDSKDNDKIENKKNKASDLIKGKIVIN